MRLRSVMPPRSSTKRRRSRPRSATLPSLIVAYSGGVDSAFLAYAAHRVLDDGVLCVTADSPSYPERHRAIARRVAEQFGLQPSGHSDCRDGSSRIPGESRKPLLLLQARALHAPARRSRASAEFAAIADGSNADDRGDYRPGRQAAREFGVRSPLDEAELTKADIRELSRRAGLPTWDEPASACLSSRIPYLYRGHRREAPDDRARRNGAPRARIPYLPRSTSRRHCAARVRAR